MRFEPFKAVDFLKFLALVVGLYLLHTFLTQSYPIDHLKYQLRLFDPLYLAFAVFVLAALFTPAFVRLYRERRLWLVLIEPFEAIDDPFIDIDISSEMYGSVQLSSTHTIKHVATYASRHGVIVRKAAYPRFFPTFRIPWSMISNVYFVAGGKVPAYGKDLLGIARLTLSFAEETVLIVPWRKRFNAFVPDATGLQTEDVST